MKEKYSTNSSGYNTLKSDNSDTLTLKPIGNSVYNFVLELGYMIDDYLDVTFNSNRLVKNSLY